jgi:hypothetical protein
MSAIENGMMLLCFSVHKCMKRASVNDTIAIATARWPWRHDNCRRDETRRAEPSQEMNRSINQSINQSIGVKQSVHEVTHCPKHSAVDEIYIDFHFVAVRLFYKARGRLLLQQPAHE